MAFVFSVVLLVLAGGIHSSPVPAKFSFEVSLKLEVIDVHFGEDADFNCKTNDPSASVTFKASHPSSPPKPPGKITKNGTTFTVHKITVHDGGMYQCVAKRKDGQTITRDIFLRIVDTSNLDVEIIPFKSKRILTGSDLTYSCVATKKLGSISWYKVIQGSPVQLPMHSLPGVSVTNYDDKVRKDLVFSNADSSQSGVYECALTYHKKSYVKAVQVDVRGPDPAKIIASSIHDIWVDNDTEIVELICQTIGFPPPKVTWKKGDQVIPKCHEYEPCANTERYIQTHNGLKIMKPRYPDDDAEFICIAKNEAGQDRRRMMVIVPSAPVLDKSFAKMYSFSRKENNPKDIPCVLAQGSPPPTFSWSYKVCWSYTPLAHLDDCVDWTPVDKMSNFFQVKNEVSKSTLVVKSTRYVPQYLYFKCTAKNMKGVDEIIAGLFERA